MLLENVSPDMQECSTHEVLVDDVQVVVTGGAAPGTREARVIKHGEGIRSWAKVDHGPPCQQDKLHGVLHTNTEQVSSKQCGAWSKQTYTC